MASSFQHGFQSIGSPIARQHALQRRYFGDRDLARLGLAPDPIDHKAAGYTSNTIDDAMRMDLEDYMPGDILVKTDRASMAHGLELRSPFLDVDFASFCISLPYRLKITPEQEKCILRRAYERDWPTTIRTRGKQGFGAPMREWLSRDSMQAIKTRYLNDPAQPLFELLPFEAIRPIVAKDDYKTWILLVLAAWLEKHPCPIRPSA